MVNIFTTLEMVSIAKAPVKVRKQILFLIVALRRKGVIDDLIWSILILTAI